MSGLPAPGDDSFPEEEPVPIAYTTQNKESIYDIAMKLHVPPSLINQFNPGLEKPLPAGKTLSIPPPDYVIRNKYKVSAVIVSKPKDISGNLWLDGTFLYFEEPDSASPYHMTVDLLGVIRARLLVHPSLLAMKGCPNFEDPSLPAQLLVVYLKDVFDKSSVDQICLSGLRCDLSSILYHILAISSMAQKGVSYATPSLNPVLKKKGVISKARAPPKLNSEPFMLVDGQSKILTLAQIEHIRLAMPSRFQICKWKLLFCTDTDGVALENLFGKAKNQQPLVLVIKIQKGGSVGAFITAPLKVQPHYFGTGETFVFKADPNVTAFKWSQKNNLFISLTPTDIMIGGPEPAIIIDANMLNGSTHASETFASPNLSGGNEFKIVKVELWCVMPMSESLSSKEGSESSPSKPAPVSLLPTP